MTSKPLSVERMFEVGPQLLATAKSIVQFLGPCRSHHPDWDELQDEARSRLKPSDAMLASRMEKSLARLEKAEAVGLLEIERRQLRADGRITINTKEPWLLFKELVRLGLVELIEPGADEKLELGEGHVHKLVRHGSQAQLEQAADNLLKTATIRYARAKAVSIRRAVAAMPAITAAENQLAREWLTSQRQPLRDLHAEFRASVADHKVVLPGLIDLHGQRHGTWNGSSVSAVLVAILDTLFEVLDGRESARQNYTDLEALDWEDLAVKLECELAELGRRHGQETEVQRVPDDKESSRQHTDPTALDLKDLAVKLAELGRRHGQEATDQGSLAAIPFAFQRILVEAAGEHLDFAEIYCKAQKDPKTARLFPRSQSTHHEQSIRGLVGGKTKDGWVICGNRVPRGSRREFWAEPIDGEQQNRNDDELRNPGAVK